jgi:hypothetical protein
MSCLVIQPERLHRRNHGASSTPRNEQRFLAHLSRQRASERVSQKVMYLLRIPSQERRT